MMKLFLLLLLTELVVSTEATTSRTSNYLRGNYDRVLKKNKLDNIDWEQFTADLAAMTDVPTTKPSLHPTTATPSTAEPTVSPTTATPSSVPSKELTLTPTKHPSNQPTTVRLFRQNNVAYCSFVLQMTTYIIFSHAQMKRHLRFKNGWNLLVNRRSSHHLFQLILLLLPRK